MDKEEYNAYMRKYFKEHGGNQAFKRMVRNLRLEVINKLGGKCIKCGFNDTRALQLDHINGGGRQELLRCGTHYAMFKKILENPEGHQILCANCNWIKRHEKCEYRSGSYKV